MPPNCEKSISQMPAILAARSMLLVEILPALKNAGIPVLAVDSLPAARAVMALQRPSLVVTTVRLGDYNGLQLALRARMEHAAVPTIVVGEADPLVEEGVEAIGAQFVTMPLEATQLVCLVARTMRIDATPRRWRRICPERPISAHVGDGQGSVVNIGYGGLGLDLPGDLAERLPALFDVRLDDYNLTLSAQRVWHQTADDRARCGALVALAGGSHDDGLKRLVDQCRSAECRERALASGFSFPPPGSAAHPQQT
jgi:DNA-binding response OmpR family regulator